MTDDTAALIERAKAYATEARRVMAEINADAPIYATHIEDLAAALRAAADQQEAGQRFRQAAIDVGALIVRTDPDDEHWVNVKALRATLAARDALLKRAHAVAEMARDAGEYESGQRGDEPAFGPRELAEHARALAAALGAGIPPNTDDVKEKDNG